MTVFDYLFLFILGCSILISVLRGLVKELMSLVAWGVSFVAANVLGAPFAAMLPTVIPGELVRLLLAFVIVLIVSLLLLSLLSKVLVQLIQSAGLTLADRGLGIIFGFLRGSVIILTLVLGASFTALPQQAWWHEAIFRPYVEGALLLVQPWLPEAIAAQVARLG
ncbi:CvpA family protein [Parvibium lacunae]|uniref:CvpA family protein n=1 Tax=Parvibium lacunae TaxID=1888893 RepID=A0A368L3A2_9BURK|nr:CvpA family protein [Parvibium lacunae]RCS58057.1 CvpA family protein [Parvibium lacunae]